MSFVPVYVEGVFVGIIASIAFLVIQNMLQLYTVDAVKSSSGILGLIAIIGLTVVVVSGPFTALLFAEVGRNLTVVLLLMAAAFLLVIGSIIVREARSGVFEEVFEDAVTVSEESE